MGIFISNLKAEV